MPETTETDPDLSSLVDAYGEARRALWRYAKDAHKRDSHPHDEHPTAYMECLRQPCGLVRSVLGMDDDD